MKDKIKIIEALTNGITPGFKMSDLEGKGIFSEEITESDDMKIITRTFTSYDSGFTKIITLYIPKESKEDVVNELNQQIQEAVKKEDYLKAAELRNQREEYLQN